MPGTALRLQLMDKLPLRVPLSSSEDEPWPQPLRTVEDSAGCVWSVSRANDRMFLIAFYFISSYVCTVCCHFAF